MPKNNRKKLLIIAGAGSAIDFGFPSTSAVDEELSRIAQIHAPTFDEKTNLYCWVKQEMHNWFIQNRCDVQDYNFEDVLNAFFYSVAAYGTTANVGSLGAFVKKEFPTILSNGIKRKVDRDFLSKFIQEMKQELVTFFRSHCKKFLDEKTDKDKFIALKVLLKQLNERYSTSIVTLNYDNLIFEAVKDMQIQTGFNSNGEFDPKPLFKNPWPSLIHLHGSVHLNFKENGNSNKVNWEESLSNEFGDLSKYGVRRTKEGVGISVSTIVSGLGKPYQLLLPPFREYYSICQRLVLEADVILFLGYSFGDSHLSVLLSDIPKKIPFIVIDWADKNKRPASINSFSGYCKDYAPIIYQLVNYTGTSSMDGRFVPFPENCFDRIDGNLRKASVWYEGFSSLIDTPSILLNEIDFYF